jgi:hypothetical protein
MGQDSSPMHDWSTVGRGRSHAGQHLGSYRLAGRVGDKPESRDPKVLVPCPHDPRAAPICAARHLDPALRPQYPSHWRTVLGVPSLCSSWRSCVGESDGPGGEHQRKLPFDVRLLRTSMTHVLWGLLHTRGLQYMQARHRTAAHPSLWSTRVTHGGRQGTKGWPRKQLGAVRGWRVTQEAQRHVGWWLGEHATRGQPQERQESWSHLPASATMEALASDAHRRDAVEPFPEEANGEVGWDHYQGRLWPGFHRHAVTVRLADSLLVWLALRRRRRPRGRGRPMTSPPSGPVVGHNGSVHRTLLTTVFTKPYEWPSSWPALSYDAPDGRSGLWSARLVCTRGTNVAPSFSIGGARQGLLRGTTHTDGPMPWSYDQPSCECASAAALSY